ncbi:MAG TPA: class I SAM-dependent methyltransferase [Mycobacteriales bacterium]|nr:class I SAM-dependent methyltransferase [Mycobacteriales bacterium]
MSTPSRWSQGGARDGRRYAERFEELAAAGSDVHGEAALCASQVPPGSRVLDAGCGTGRVAIRLAELGYDCVGVDSDASMLAEARRASTGVTWLLRDLAAIGDIEEFGGRFDLVVAAGNVIPLLAPGSEPVVVAGLAGCLRQGGLLVSGFGLDAAHLPLGEAPFGLSSYDDWCDAAGLLLENRYATWAADPYADGPYAVTLHRRTHVPSVGL